MSGNTPKAVFLNHWAVRFGGAEYSLLDILAEAVKTFECILVTTERGPLVEKATRLGVRSIVLPLHQDLSKIRRERLLPGALSSLGGVLRFFHYCIGLARLLKSIDPIVTHANVPKSHIALMLARRFGFQGPVCFHLREIFSSTGGVPTLYRLLFPRNSSSVIAISDAVRRSLPEALQNRTTVLYNGVRQCESVGSKRPSEEGKLKLVYLGRVVPWKGCDVLVDILARFLERNGNDSAELTLIGDTVYWPITYRQELQSLIEQRGVSHCCRLLPHTTDPYLAMRQHDVFCNTSFHEPFGRVIAEAQACALPVVAFDSGGVAEIIEDRKTGILVPHGNIQQFVAALEVLRNEPKQRWEMGRAGATRADALFNVETQAGRIVSFLKDRSGK